MHEETKFHDHGNLDILTHVPDAEKCERSAEVFSHLCDGTRLRILWLLCHSEECVNNIAKAVNMSAPAVSHHLKILRQANIISATRIGKEIHYKLAENPKAKLVHKMIDDIFEMKCTILF